MILADVNVLVYAFRREAQQHQRYAGWLTDVVREAEELALHEAPLAGFVLSASEAAWAQFGALVRDDAGVAGNLVLRPFCRPSDRVIPRPSAVPESLRQQF